MSLIEQKTKYAKWILFAFSALVIIGMVSIVQDYSLQQSAVYLAFLLVPVFIFARLNTLASVVGGILAVRHELLANESFDFKALSKNPAYSRDMLTGILVIFPILIFGLSSFDLMGLTGLFGSTLVLISSFGAMFLIKWKNVMKHVEPSLLSNEAKSFL